MIREPCGVEDVVIIIAKSMRRGFVHFHRNKAWLKKYVTQKCLSESRVRVVVVTSACEEVLGSRFCKFL